MRREETPCDTASMWTAEERQSLRFELIEAARADPRIVAAAITGSASVGQEDRWSDIDLAFGVGEDLEGALGAFTERMARRHGALHHVDVPSGTWIYRVFLLPSTLQVDLAFAPSTDFGARGPTFALVFGEARAPAPRPETSDESIGWGWLYALHARSSMARGKPWQAEYMVSGLRDRTLALACRRHGLPAREARGVDRLPREVTASLEDGLVRALDRGELARAFRVCLDALQREIEAVDRELAARLRPALDELASST